MAESVSNPSIDAILCLVDEAFRRQR